MSLENWRQNKLFPDERRIVPSADQLAVRENTAWIDFFGEPIVVPTPSFELLDTLARAYEFNFTTLEPIYLPRVQFTQDATFPGWKVRPNDVFWRKISEGEIAQDAASLPGDWILFDTIFRPDYNRGRQLHEDDALNPLLVQLRQSGTIDIMPNYAFVPLPSRFALSVSEIRNSVNRATADFLGVDASTVRLPQEIVLNVLDNRSYPHLGQADTWEWTDDVVGKDGSLFVASSEVGGLTHISVGGSDCRHSHVAFRQIIKPQLLISRTH